MLSRDVPLEWQKSEDKLTNINNDSILGIYEECVNDCVKSGTGLRKIFHAPNTENHIMSCNVWIVSYL